MLRRALPVCRLCRAPAGARRWAGLFHFYNHPPLAAYKLNKLLYDSRFKPNMRARLLQDAATAAGEYGLSPELTRALPESLAFHHLDTDRPGKDADPLVEAGAHPVGALMAMHVLQHEKRKSRQGAPESQLVAG